MRERITFDRQADARGFAVAYPDGYGGCWAGGRGITTADEAGVDDVAFLRGELRGADAVPAGDGGVRARRRPVPPGPGDTRVTEFSSRTTAEGGVGGTRVTAWTVFGGGHTRPGSAPAPGYAEMTTQEFDAAEEICRSAEPLHVSEHTRRL